MTATWVALITCSRIISNQQYIPCSLYQMCLVRDNVCNDLPFRPDDNNNNAGWQVQRVPQLLRPHPPQSPKSSCPCWHLVPNWPCLRTAKKDVCHFPALTHPVHLIFYRISAWKMHMNTSSQITRSTPMLSSSLAGSTTRTGRPYRTRNSPSNTSGKTVNAIDAIDWILVLFMWLV